MYVVWERCYYRLYLQHKSNDKRKKNKIIEPFLVNNFFKEMIISVKLLVH